MTQTLTLDILKQAVAGSAAAFRRVMELQPAGGPGAKVFPPTYEGGRYCTEERRINGETVKCVLLDSVQSQANRMELALQDAIDEGLITLPLITVNFTNTVAPWAGKISSLQAPHRIADAILRDSEYNGVPFRQSEVGNLLAETSVHSATILFQYCPTALVFGMWDSTGPRGGMGAKFARAVVSEIIGVNAVPGERTSSRIDPLQIAVKAGPVYAMGDDDWTLDKERANKDDKGNPILYGKKGEGKPSSVNHGNVTPSLVVQKDKNRNPVNADGQPTKKATEFIPIGGYTIDRALQITTISLPALRRLKFPLNNTVKPETNRAARAVLVALGLCAATLSGEQGYDLRSQCLLTAATSFTWELLDQPGQAPQTFALNGEQAIALLKAAIADAEQAGLPWQEDVIALTPRADLVELVRKSYAGNGADAEEEGNEE